MKKLVYVVLAILVLFGCARKEASESVVLAKVGEEIITLEKFNEQLSNMPPAYQETLRDNKELLLDDMIIEEILYKEAVKRGLHAEEEVKSILEGARKRIMIARLIKNEVDDKVIIEDEDISDYYRDHKDEFMTPEMFRASHILVGTLEEAVGIVDQLNAGADFEELARKYSLDLTSKRGGDIGYFVLGQMVPEFEDVCVKLNVGEISNAIKTQFGYHVIKLTDKKDPAPIDFSKAEERIRISLSNRRKRESFDRLVNNLKERSKITKNLELLEPPEEESEGAALLEE